MSESKKYDWRQPCPVYPSSPSTKWRSAEFLKTTTPIGAFQHLRRWSQREVGVKVRWMLRWGLLEVGAGEFQGRLRQLLPRSQDFTLLVFEASTCRPDSVPNKA